MGLGMEAKSNQMALITAVFLANGKGITPTKLRRALRRSKSDGAPDLQWHHHGDRWQADDVTEPERVESMKRVLRDIAGSVLIWLGALVLLLAMPVVCAGATQYQMPSHIGKFVPFPSVAESRLVNIVSRPVGVIDDPVDHKLHLWGPVNALRYLVGPRINLFPNRYVVFGQKKTGIPLQDLVIGLRRQLQIGIFQPNDGQLAARNHICRAVSVIVNMKLKLSHCCCSSRFFLYLHDEPRSLRVDKSLYVQQCSFGRHLSGLCRNSHLSSLPPHAYGLVLESLESKTGIPDSADSNGDKQIVREDSGLVPAVLACFFVGIVIECLAITMLWKSGGANGRWLLALAILCFACAGVSFWIGCFPWRWKTCVCDKKKHGEYRQIFQHNSTIVPHKYLDIL